MVPSCSRTISTLRLARVSALEMAEIACDRGGKRHMVHRACLRCRVLMRLWSLQADAYIRDRCRI